MSESKDSVVGRATAAIRVAVRVRPFDERETASGAISIVDCVSRLNQVCAYAHTIGLLRYTGVDQQPRLHIRLCIRCSFYTRRHIRRVRCAHARQDICRCAICYTSNMYSLHVTKLCSPCAPSITAHSQTRNVITKQCTCRLQRNNLRVRPNGQREDIYDGHGRDAAHGQRQHARHHPAHNRRTVRTHYADTGDSCSCQQRSCYAGRRPTTVVHCSCEHVGDI